MTKRDRAEELAIAAAFGRRVREDRIAKKMTQEGLAEAAGIHATFVSNLERGYRVPSLPTVLRIARGLDTSPGSLIDNLR